MKKIMIRRDIDNIVILTLFVALVSYRLFWPVAQLVVTPDFGRSDSFDLSIATKYFLWQKLHINEIPLWSKDIGSGYPVHAEGQIGIFFVPNLLLYRVFDFVNAYNLSLVLSVWLFAIGMYAWFRTTKYSLATSLYAAVTSAFSGIVFTHLTHITLLQSFSLLPFVMVSAQSLLQKPSVKKALILGTLLSQQFLAGFVQAAFITGLLLSGFVVYNFFERKDQIKRYLCLFFLSLIVFIGQSMVLLLPAREFLSQISNPHGFSFATATKFDFPLKHLWTFLDPFWLGNPKYGTYPSFSIEGSIFWENTGFLGWVPIGFFVLTFYRSMKRRDSITFFWFVVLGISLLLMLGDKSPIYFIYSYWPFNLFRVPSRFIWVFVISFVWLSSLSFEVLWKSFGNSVIKKSILFLLVVINSIALILTWNSYNEFMPAHTWLQKPEAISYFEVDSRIMSIGTEQKHTELFITKGWQSMQQHVFWRNFIYPNSNLFWGVSHTGESMGRVLRRPLVFRGFEQQEIIFGENEATVSASLDHLVSLSGTHYVITPFVLENSTKLKQTAKLQYELDAIYIYKNLDTPQRVYLAQNIQKVETLNQFRKLLQDTSIDFSTAVFTEGMSDIEAASVNAHAQIVKDADTYIEIQASGVKENNLLVLRDTWYPGWKATVDLKPTTIYPVNIYQRGVVVPKGEHVVVFIYQPESFLRGLYVSIFFWIGTIVLWLGNIFLRRNT